MQTKSSSSVGIVWQTLNNIINGLLERLPYLVIALVVFVLFWLFGSIMRSIISATGTKTRLDVTLAELLGRRASVLFIILGVFVAAVVIFPGFNPGDLVAGLGITSVAVGFAFKGILQNFFAGIFLPAEDSQYFFQTTTTPQSLRVEIPKVPTALATERKTDTIGRRMHRVLTDISIFLTSLQSKKLFDRSYRSFFGSVFVFVVGVVGGF